jgi:hypothetical protein
MLGTEMGASSPTKSPPPPHFVYSRCLGGALVMDTTMRTHFDGLAHGAFLARRGSRAPPHLRTWLSRARVDRDGSIDRVQTCMYTSKYSDLSILYVSTAMLYDMHHYSNWLWSTHCCTSLSRSHSRFCVPQVL